VRIRVKFIIRVHIMARFRVDFWINDVVRFTVTLRDWIRVWVKVMDRVMISNMVRV
jgi:hypothetical protein